jgi:hypothetical protein
MSEPRKLVANEETVYVVLLNEGTTCVRPTKGIRLGPNIYGLLPTPNYDPEDEEWEFPPGTVVECAIERWSSEGILVAKRRIGLPGD